MKRFVSLFFSILLLVLFIGCQQSSDSGNGNGGTTTPTPTPPAATMNGTWTGGGTFTLRSDGHGLGMPFDLTLVINQVGNTLQGTGTISRVSLGTRSGPIVGTNVGGVVNLQFECCWFLDGIFAKDAGKSTFNFNIREEAHGGSWDWITGTGTVTR